MDLELINVARKGDVDGLKQLHGRDSNVLYQVTHAGNTLLHLSAKFGDLNFLIEVCDLCPSLISMTNKYGDTALHVGAIAGYRLVVNHLIYRMTSSDDDDDDDDSSSDLLRSQNHKGDSALHEALRYCRCDVAKLLIEKEPHLCCLVNNARESPLFLAVIKGYNDMVDHILKSCPSPACDGPKGWTVLHASIVVEEQGVVLFNMTKKLLQAKPELIRAVDIYGRTPLHYAVDMNKALIVRFLLQSDPSVAYIQEKDGWSPLHVAANYHPDRVNLEISIVEDIIQYCPDLEYLRDNRGNNFLHVLMERMMKEDSEDLVLAFNFSTTLRTLELEELLNQPNNDGNTPLHLATLYKRPSFEQILVNDARVDKKARNNNNLTAFDIARNQYFQSGRKEDDMIAWSNMSSNLYPYNQPLISSQPRMWIQTLKPDFGVIPEDLEEHAKKRRTTQEQLRAAEEQTRTAEEEEEAARRKTSKTHMLVATLIATVAFAAALEMPGGFDESDGDEKGMAVLAGEAAFVAFVISDAMALSCSLLTLLLFFFVDTVNYCRVLFSSSCNHSNCPTTKTMAASAILIFVAIVAMSVAFLCGVFAVLVRTHSLWIGIVTMVICLSVPVVACFLAPWCNKDA